MFTIDTHIDSPGIMEKQLFKVLFSMNSHQVANPEMSLEDARSYVFFFRESGKIQVYVGLYFGDTDRRMFYTHSANPFPEAEMVNMEGDARAFAEDLGAMLDEIDFSRLSSDEKKQWLAEQEIFSSRKKEPENRTQPGQEAQPVAEQPAPPPVQAQAAPIAQPAPVAAAPASVPIPPPVQPAPPVVPTPAVPAAQPGSAVAPAPIPVEIAPVQQVVPTPPAAVPVPAPVQQSQPSPPPAPPQADPGHQPQPGAAHQARVKQPPVPQRKTGSPAVAQTNAPASGSETEPQVVQRADDVLEEAVKAGVVKAPKAQLKKDIQSATGLISRDKEALARLLASF